MKKHNKVIASLLVFAILLAGTITLSIKPAKAFASTAQDDPLIGICLPEQSSYYTELAQETAQELHALGLYHVETAFADSDSTKQVEQISALMQKEPAILIIAPVNAIDLETILQRADNQGISVIHIGLPSIGLPSASVHIYWDFFGRGVLDALQLCADRDLDTRAAGDPAYLNIYLPFCTAGEVYLAGTLHVLRQYMDAGVLHVNICWVQDAAEVYRKLSDALAVPGGNTADAMSIVKDFSRAARQAYEDAGYPSAVGAKFYGEAMHYPVKNMAEIVAALAEMLLNGEDIATGSQKYPIAITDEGA